MIKNKCINLKILIVSDKLRCREYFNYGLLLGYFDFKKKEENNSTSKQLPNLLTLNSNNIY